MPTRNSTGGKPAAPSPASKSTAKTTASGPAGKHGGNRPQKGAASTAEAKLLATERLVAAIPANANKAAEYGEAHAAMPPTGITAEPDDPAFLGSTLTETTPSAKLGDGKSVLGHNAGNEPLTRVRVDSGDQGLTTNQGIPVADNQSSLKAGLRGPTLLEDFVLREKLTHFDHERIPERIVHARGSGAHGYFESYGDLSELTCAAPFAEAGKRTPAFVRFSTVAGERGSTDVARDVRGFAVKLYTEAGNWDIVGNNMPVFFIQDAMKFPDLVHAVKPEPHHGMPQAASAHDTFWDFAGLMPETTHMLMWAMSDRALPRSLRMMQGFGVHTFRLVTAEGATHFVKFHWQPLAGTHSLVWDEAVKISGADSDFHRRDLWEAIEAGAFPEWELQLQVFTEEQAEGFSFDVLDATKLVPEELVPLRAVGKLVLNRNPDNFFAETEQVAFGTANVIPGIDFSNDPLLAGRHHSYLDTQLSRLGGPNFHEIPINAPMAQVHNNQRDGIHRQAIPRGRVAYEPNSLGGGCPFQQGMKGFRSFPEPIAADKLRGKPEKFADHFTQARLFFHSQTVPEQNHIVAAFRFELSKVQTAAIRERIVAMLLNVDESLATRVAEGIGLTTLPAVQPPALATPVEPEITESPMLSLTARPGDGGIATRKIAVIVADGCDGAAALALHAALLAADAVPRFVGVRLGEVKPHKGKAIDVEVSFEAGPSVVYDAIALPDGDAAIDALLAVGHVAEFVKDAYRHCKTISAPGAAKRLLEAIGIDETLPEGEPDPGVLTDGDSDAFIAAIGLHRHFARDRDPPLI